ncbi:MAG: hypothetical protein ACK4M6_06435 [Hyphomonas sp.]
MITRLTALVAALFLSACVSAFEPVKFDRAATPITTIAISKDMAYDRPSAYGGAGASAAFGAIGGIASAAIAEDRATKLDAALSIANFDAEKLLEEVFASELTGAGFEVSVKDFGPRPKNSMAGASIKVPYKSFEGAPKDVDAYLDVVMGWGYSAAQSTLWVPVVGIDINLVSATDSKILAKDGVGYGPKQFREGTTFILHDEAKGFKSFDELASDPEAAAKMLTEAILATAQVAASKIK